MRLVFTKLETPKKNILVDLGTGEFEEFSLEELEDSETGKYLQIPDTIPANSIRVKTNSSELESFDMIKEYQITDDEGNILGGSSSFEEIEASIGNTCDFYYLSLNSKLNDLYVKILDNFYAIGHIPQDVIANNINNIDGAQLYVQYSCYENGTVEKFAYAPLAYKIKLV